MKARGGIPHTRIPEKVFVTDMERFALNFGMYNQNMKRIPMHTMHTTIYEARRGQGGEGDSAYPHTKKGICY